MWFNLRRLPTALFIPVFFVLSACSGPGIAMPIPSYSPTEIPVLTGGTGVLPTDQPPLVQGGGGYVVKAVVEFKKSPAPVRTFTGATY
jgi:hypothetical protein